MQDPDTVDHVERAVGERQVHDVGLVERHVRVMAEVARRSLDGRAQIDRVDLGARVDADLREPPHPAARIEDTLAAKALERQPGLLHERVFAAGGAVGGVELRLGERVPLVPEGSGVVLRGNEAGNAIDDRKGRAAGRALPPGGASWHPCERAERVGGVPASGRAGLRGGTPVNVEAGVSTLDALQHRNLVSIFNLGVPGNSFRERP